MHGQCMVNAFVDGDSVLQESAAEAAVATIKCIAMHTEWIPHMPAMFGVYNTPDKDLTLEWRKDGKALQTSRAKVDEDYTTKYNQTTYRYQTTWTSTLTIDRVRHSDAGTYSCVAVSEGYERESRTKVDVIKRLKFKKRPKDQIVVGDEPVTLDCSVEFDESANVKIEWTHEPWGWEIGYPVPQGGEVGYDVVSSALHQNFTHASSFSLPLIVGPPEYKRYGYQFRLGKRYNCNVHATSTKNTQSLSSTAYIYRVESPCDMLTKPCLRGGTCHSSSSRKSYTCECPPPFYGDKCQFLDYDAYGLKGITAFDNSREGDHLLKLN